MNANHCPSEWIPQRATTKRCQASLSLPSKKFKQKVQDRAEYMDMTFNGYIVWILKRELFRDPRKDYDRLYKKNDSTI